MRRRSEHLSLLRRRLRSDRVVDSAGRQCRRPLSLAAASSTAATQSTSLSPARPTSDGRSTRHLARSSGLRQSGGAAPRFVQSPYGATPSPSILRLRPALGYGVRWSRVTLADGSAGSTTLAGRRRSTTASRLAAIASACARASAIPRASCVSGSDRLRSRLLRRRTSASVLPLAGECFHPLGTFGSDGPYGDAVLVGIRFRFARLPAIGFAWQASSGGCSLGRG